MIFAELSWAHGVSDSGSGLAGHTKNKPRIVRGGQIVVVTDVNYFHPRANLHHHKPHKFNWSNVGSAEAKTMWEKLKTMLPAEPLLDDPSSDGNGVDSMLMCPKPLFHQKPHVAWDNCFSSDKLLHCAATEGFGLTMTVQCGCPPSNVPNKHHHREKLGSGPQVKVALFKQPIVLTEMTRVQSLSHPSSQPGLVTLPVSMPLTSVDVLLSLRREEEGLTRDRGASK